MKITVKEAIQQIKRGKMIIITDDDTRENEGDIFLPALFATPENVNFICKYARGLICAPTTSERLESLSIPLMVKDNEDKHMTAFSVSVDAVNGTTTGISAQDRSITLKTLADPNAKASDFSRPGHIFPLMANPKGLCARRGHTEAAVELLKLADLPTVGVICEIMSDDGTMARGQALEQFSNDFNLGTISIDDIVCYLQNSNKEVDFVSKTLLPTKYGTFYIYAFEELASGKCHLALQPVTFDASCTCPDVRIHSECLTGDVFGSLRCDCKEQLEDFLNETQSNSNSILIYLRQEGRGIGLSGKIRAYALQDRGYDTVEANTALGFNADERKYDAAGQILKYLGFNSVRLFTNNPKKIAGLEATGINVVDMITRWVGVTELNHKYIQTKIEKMGHIK